MKTNEETQSRNVGPADANKLTCRRICVAFVPLLALIGMIVLGVTVFGRDVGDGASQISLVFATALASVLAIAFGRVSWRDLEHGIASSISKAGISIMILFLIGMLTGAWMIGGVVPTLICYGVKIMNPHLFLVCACVICAIVSLMTGTSWTTVATIGVALLGIGTALGVPAPWSAGAIISGAYFGDKLSPLSDTTILASSATGTDLFVHIRYMLLTTIPSMTLTLIIFLVAGFFLVDASAVDVQGFEEGLSRTFHITLWTLLVPIATGALMNVAAGDQYISILITSDMFRDAYREKGLESRLLSRAIEDSSTVTSVLVPWNTCAMAQSTSLGIATVAYLPFCFFNLISPFMSVIMAAIGWKIVRPPEKKS